VSASPEVAPVTRGSNPDSRAQEVDTGSRVGVQGAQVPRRAKTLAMWSAAGSHGRTTTALNLASTLANMQSSDSQRTLDVLLIDLDLVAPSLALTLNARDHPTLTETVAAAEFELTKSDFFARYAPSANPRQRLPRLLAGLAKPQRWRELPLRETLEVIDHACLIFDVVVFDMHASSHRSGAQNALTRSVLVQADVVIALANANAVALARLLTENEELLRLRLQKPVVTVFNRLEGAAKSCAEASAFQVLTHQPPPLLLREDGLAFELAIRQARPVWHRRRPTQYQRDMQALATHVLTL